jgi:hypothetical protein
MDEVDPTQVSALVALLIQNPSVLLPSGSVFTLKAQILAERLLGLLQFVVCLCTPSAVQERRGIKANLEAVHQVHAPAE